MSSRLRSAALSIGAAAALTLAVAGCGGEGTVAQASASRSAGADYPVTVESCKRSETFTAAPQRVVLGWATSIRTLAALGVADRVTGYVSGSNVKVPDGFTATEVSPDFQPAKEAVLAARPDLFLANDENQISGQQGTATPDDLAAQNGHAYVLGGYCLAAPAPGTVDAVYADVEKLGKIFGVGPKAVDVVADLKKRVAQAQKPRGNAAPAKVAMIQVYDGKVYALSGSYYNAILEGAGLTNVFGDLKENFAEISAEKVLTVKPDALFIAHDDPAGGDEALAAARKEFAASPAVTAGKIFGISNLEISGGGVNIVTLIEQTAKQAYGA
ncbi:ABC transporter substrate-binding protein [Cryptosporangium arvum]|uniref:ABC-type Fe3+-hydroxamate transport system, periplasmic component n=1 Tax=Cryptosporangium arvum DSM 44712 TaxID=927661 RepID=A0A010YJS6_9ACTN|nr:ABC transporter substrate-binding protein [Cryptosporangium arvum]EXG80495.1 ABC-type Fe3+-hydroxamate transport system, periplasmic component [Cryptosporangium arvum DSM 44712]